MAFKLNDQNKLMYNKFKQVDNTCTKKFVKFKTVLIVTTCTLNF